MATKTYKPTSAGRRGMSAPDFSNLTNKKPERRLTKGKKATSGRGNTGRITVRFRGGGHKRRLREVDFKRQKLEYPLKL